MSTGTVTPVGDELSKVTSTIHLKVVADKCDCGLRPHKAKKGDVIKFVSDDMRNFAVDFVDRTPGDKMHLSNEDPILAITKTEDRDASSMNLYPFKVSIDGAPTDQCGDIQVGT